MNRTMNQFSKFPLLFLLRLLKMLRCPYMKRTSSLLTRRRTPSVVCLDIITINPLELAQTTEATCCLRVFKYSGNNTVELRKNVLVNSEEVISTFGQNSWYTTFPIFTLRVSIKISLNWIIVYLVYTWSSLSERILADSKLENDWSCTRTR